VTYSKTLRIFPLWCLLSEEKKWLMSREWKGTGTHNERSLFSHDKTLDSFDYDDETIIQLC
jgi:hypothetical protein